MPRLRFAPLAAALLLAIACSGPPEPAKVVIVGVDGATFSVIDPLVAAGELPNFAHLLATGTRGTLRAQGALVSPPIWTTVATGHLPRDHGIRSFFYEGADGGRVLVDTSRRKVGALWNWMGPLDRTVGVAGWWDRRAPPATAPATAR